MPASGRNRAYSPLPEPLAFRRWISLIGATNDKRFRAFDSKTGRELWETKLDYSAIAVPITYMGKNYRQYVAITAANGGAGVTDPDRRGGESLMVYTLP